MLNSTRIGMSQITDRGVIIQPFDVPDENGMDNTLFAVNYRGEHIATCDDWESAEKVRNDFVKKHNRTE